MLYLIPLLHCSHDVVFHHQLVHSLYKGFVCLFSSYIFSVCCLFSLANSRLDMCLMASVPGMTNEGTPLPEEPFVFPFYINVGPPYIATLSLLGLTIGLLVWLFSTQVIHNVASPSFVSTSPQEHQPHVDPSPSSLVRYYSPSSLVRSSYVSSSLSIESSEVSNLVNKKRNKGILRIRKIKKGPNFQPLPNMLENNKLLLIMLGVLMMPRSPKQPIRPSTLARFVRVSIFLRISLVYPRLYKHGLHTLTNPCCQPMNNMLMTSCQLVRISLGRRKVESSSHVGYAEGVIKLTFSLVWMKPRNYWKT
jgi:hypothetical protein